MTSETEPKKEQQPEAQERPWYKPSYSILVLGVVSAVLTMPLFMLLYKYFPNLSVTMGGKNVRLDHIILFLALFFLIYYLVKKLRVVMYIIMIAGLLVMTVTNFTGVYTLSNLYHDYSQFLYNLSGNSFEQKFAFETGPFSREQLLRDAVDYQEPDVRNYAASIATRHFQDQAYLSKNRRWVQFFSIFKEIYSHWKYVFDPVNEEYYSKASETLTQLQYDEYFKGDCDDYSIMMGACIKSVGGEVKLIRTVVKHEDKAIGHLYPEVKFGDTKDLETVVYLIKNVYFVEESRDKPIYYYLDEKGFIWLNFDYNDDYPGGKYQSNIRKAEIVL